MKSGQNSWLPNEASTWSWLPDPADQSCGKLTDCIKGWFRSSLSTNAYPYKTRNISKYIFVIPPCPGKWVEVNCSSKDYKYKSCPVGDGTSIILYATATAIHSEAECNYFFKDYLFYRGDNGDYGHKKNLLWVDNGCQATFNICLGILSCSVFL